ncbi:MAG: DUF192 domain-containing protein [Patescibacteria group bacterium]
MLYPSAKQRLLIFFGGALIVSGGFVWLHTFRQTTDGTVPKAASIGEQTYALEIADTDIERAQGLSGRDSLCQECGMLFVFEKPGRYAFWMKDMRFSLDIVWLLDDTVVFVARAVSPNISRILSPAVPADQVLEVNAGAVENLEVGERVRFLY